MSYDGNPIIYPFALVKFDLFKPVPEPPHTEDVHYDPGSPKFVRVVQSREEVLAWSNFESVEAIFEQPVNDDFGYYVMDFQGPRSLGTLRPRKIIKAKYEIGPEGAWDYHLIFVDGEGELFRLKITDLTWQYYCQSLKGSDRDQKKIASHLTDILNSSKVFLRIGLARGWQKFPDRCCLQITGIFTFPDYLEGKTFLDIAPVQRRMAV